MITVNVEVMLKDRDTVTTDSVVLPYGEPATWNEAAVRSLLVEMLRAIDRARNPDAPRDRPVSLTGFNWIVEPVGDQVMLALLIPMGMAAAGPLAVAQKPLDDLVGAVLRQERGRSSSTTVH
jgi:hypothetical protein